MRQSGSTICGAIIAHVAQATIEKNSLITTVHAHELLTSHTSFVYQEEPFIAFLSTYNTGCHNKFLITLLYSIMHP